MKTKKVLMLLATTCLVLALAVSPFMAACAKPVEPGAAEIAALQKEIAALEKKVAAAEKGKAASEKEVAASEKEIASLEGKVATSEKEIAKLEAAVPEPVEVIEIAFNNSCPYGTYQDAIEYIKANVEEASGGRIQVKITLGEAVCPTGEQLVATGKGVFDMLVTWYGYFRKEVPVLEITNFGMSSLKTSYDLWVMYEFKGWGELVTQELAKVNIYPVLCWCEAPGTALVSKVPIPSFADLKGLKIRAVGTGSMILEEAGAGVIFIPAEEIYTALATGLIDAAYYGSPSSNYGAGLHEVTKYWIMPPLNPMYDVSIHANMDFWNGLSEADRALVDNISRLGLLKSSRDNYWKSLECVVKARETGVEVVYWDDASVKQWMGYCLGVIPEPKDDASALAKEQLFDYMRAMGYID